MRSTKKKILVLAENLDIQITSSSRRTSKIIVALSNDYDVTVLYPPAHDSDFNWLPNVQMVSLEPFKESTSKGFSLSDKINSRRTGFSYREHNQIRTWKKGIKNVLSHKKYTALFALASGVDFYTHHALATMEVAIPILSYYHDPYPWLYYPKTYRRSEAKIIQKLKARSLEKVLKKSKANIFPSQKLGHLYREQYPFSEESMMVVPHLNLSLHNIYYWESGKEYPLSETDFNITYAGALHPSRKVETLVDSFIDFLTDLPHTEGIYLNFIGPLGDYEKYIQEKMVLFPQNIRAFGRVGYDQSITHLKNSQVNVIIEADDTSSPFLPGKFPDYVKVDRPIVHIGPKNSEVRRLLGEEYTNAVKHGEKQVLSGLLNDLYERFKKEEPLSLSRPDLLDYLSPEAFRHQMHKILMPYES